MPLPFVRAPASAVPAPCAAQNALKGAESAFPCGSGLLPHFSSVRRRFHRLRCALRATSLRSPALAPLRQVPHAVTVLMKPRVSFCLCGDGVTPPAPKGERRPRIEKEKSLTLSEALRADLATAQDPRICVEVGTAETLQAGLCVRLRYQYSTDLHACQGANQISFRPCRTPRSSPTVRLNYKPDKPLQNEDICATYSAL